MEPTAPTTYEAETRGVNVRVVTSYIPEHSDPPSRYVWAYMVRIETKTEQTVDLAAPRPAALIRLGLHGADREQVRADRAPGRAPLGHHRRPGPGRGGRGAGRGRRT